MNVIYAFRSPGSGAVYIGKHQCDPEGWPRRGTGRLPDGYKGSGVAVANFHRRHGAAVQWRILAVVGGDVNATERRAIRLALRLFGRMCVNRADGGDGFTSDAAKAQWADPEVRAKLTAARKAQWSDPEARAKVIAAQNRPEARAKVSAARKARWADPEYAAKVSAANKAKWSDPEARAKLSAAVNQPDVRAKKSAAAKALAATPEGRAQLARAQASCNTPEARAKAAATRARNKEKNHGKG